MKILVINCGSSSLKYQLFDMENESVMAKGLVERIGITGSRIKHEVCDEEYITETSIPNHNVAVKLVFDTLVGEHGVIKDLSEITAVGHRAVHGGEAITESVLINDEVKKVLEDCVVFSPLHNPANLQGIYASEKALPGVPNVAVFDTAFHQTMPSKNYMYAIPYEYYDNYKIRKYGFHGTSHMYITHRTAELLGKDVKDINLISCHLGNGASVTAVKNGKSFNTTMGLTPLEGLVMGTRSGSLDPAVVTFLQEKEGLTPEEVNNLLNKKSGVLGVSGKSSDFRDLEEAAEQGDEKSKLALDMFAERVKDAIGMYAVELGSVDAIVFTGGIGENSDVMRKEILTGLEVLGVEISEEVNAKRKPKEKVISTDNSKIKVMVVPTDEELMIARDTKRLVENK